MGGVCIVKVVSELLYLKAKVFLAGNSNPMYTVISFEVMVYANDRYEKFMHSFLGHRISRGAPSGFPGP